jgi:exopolyphosphatase/guanosine-5'-triphosphate,3'-diphosphate pyrophosphatase
MLYGVIDIGSNSARLMMHDGRKTLYKRVKITALAENMGKEKVLTEVAIKRTALAISEFVQHAKEQKADKIYAFATAAVRYAVNKKDFLDSVKNLAGIDVEVVSGEMEAELGYKGALNGKDGGIIDIGGASAEVVAVKNNVKLYEKSLDIGVVKIKDNCGQDKKRITEFCSQKIKEYGDIPKTEFFGIGGTATSLASIILELEPYDPEKVNGFKIEISVLEKLCDKLFSMSLEDRKKLKGLQPERAEVIAGGAMLLLQIMKKIGIEHITVSESDNLEGYLMCKMEKI